MVPSNERAVAARLSAAYEAGDLEVLAKLLHPNVRWGGDEETAQTCHGPADVLSWYERSYASGVRACVDAVLTRPGAALLTVRVKGGQFETTTVVHQVFRLTDGLIADIRGYPERESAMELFEEPLPTPS